MQEQLELHIRYCGGCNPTYDRVALVSELLSVSGWAKKGGSLAPGDIWLGVCGCTRECVRPPGGHLRHIAIHQSIPVLTLIEQIKKGAEKSWE